jgi:hypothetical protein
MQLHVHDGDLARRVDAREPTVLIGVVVQVQRCVQDAVLRGEADGYFGADRAGRGVDIEGVELGVSSR